MKRKQMTALFASVCMAFSWAGTSVMAEEDLVGTLAFAQCDDYVTIRSSADRESDATGKIYNDCAATIIGEENGWYKITSGNATGYVNADYFATGEEAQEIADRTAYNVATVHPEVLMVRTQPDEEAEVLDTAQQSEELEVVQWDGDWMKVALDADTYGYVNAYYVDYHTYYPVGETLEEEQQRLAAQEEARQAKEAAQQAAYQEQQTAGENAGTQPVETVSETEGQYSEYTEQTEYVETEGSYEEPGYIETEGSYEEPEYTETEAPYEEPEYVETEAPYEEPEYAETEAPYEEPEYTETEAPYEESEYVETEVPYEEPEYAETEAPYEEPEYTETEYVEAETSGLGQQIADYAVQFVGNPYVYGGTSLTNGADCSGFTQSVMANFGIGIARTAADQSYGGTAVDMSNLQPGDLIFYASGGYVGHVALYIGGGQIVHASTEETGIIISNYDYNTPYCARRYW